MKKPLIKIPSEISFKSTTTKSTVVGATTTTTTVNTTTCMPSTIPSSNSIPSSLLPSSLSSKSFLTSTIPYGGRLKSIQCSYIESKEIIFKYSRAWIKNDSQNYSKCKDRTWYECFIILMLDALLIYPRNTKLKDLISNNFLKNSISIPLSNAQIDLQTSYKKSNYSIIRINLHESGSQTFLKFDNTKENNIRKWWEAFQSMIVQLNEYLLFEAKKKLAWNECYLEELNKFGNKLPANLIEMKLNCLSELNYFKEIVDTGTAYSTRANTLTQLDMDHPILASVLTDNTNTNNNNECSVADELNNNIIQGPSNETHDVSSPVSSISFKSLQENRIYSKDGDENDKVRCLDQEPKQLNLLSSSSLFESHSLITKDLENIDQMKENQSYPLSVTTDFNIPKESQQLDSNQPNEMNIISSNDSSCGSFYAVKYTNEEAISPASFYSFQLSPQIKMSEVFLESSPIQLYLQRDTNLDVN